MRSLFTTEDTEVTEAHQKEERNEDVNVLMGFPLGDMLLLLVMTLFGACLARDDTEYIHVSEVPLRPLCPPW